MACLEVESKSLATRAVRKAFSTASFDKHKRGYKNVRKSISFEDSQSRSDYTRDTDSEIGMLKQQISEHKAKAEGIMADIGSYVNEEDQPGDKTLLKVLLDMYSKEMESVSKLSDNVDMIYERELRLLLEKDEKLSAKEKGILVQEWDTLSTLVNKGMRTGNSLLEDHLSADIFKTLLVDFYK